MYRWVVNEQRWLTLSDVRHVAPELWRSLCRLRRVAERARHIAADARHSPDQRTQMVIPTVCLLPFHAKIAEPILINFGIEKAEILEINIGYYLLRK